MKGKCLECENYYLQMRYRFLVPSGKVVNIHGCNDPDVVSMYAPAGHPFVLDAKGDDIEVLDCNSFEPKEDKP